MVRPIKWKKGWYVKSVMIAEEYREVWLKAAEAAEREGKPLHQFISEALAFKLESIAR